MDTKTVFGKLLTKDQKMMLVRIIRRIAREEASKLLDEHLRDYDHCERKVCYVV